MARTRPDNTDRDRAIVAKHTLGTSLETIAAEYSISRQRAGQIVKAAAPHHAPGEAERAEIAAELRRKYDQLERITANPPLKVSAMSKPTEDPRRPGSYVVDESVTIRAIAEQNRIADRYRQMFGVDIHQPPAPLFTEQHLQVMANVEAARSRLAQQASISVPRPALPAGYAALNPEQQMRAALDRERAHRDALLAAQADDDVVDAEIVDD